MFKGSVKVQVQDFTKVSWGLMEMEAYFSLGGDWHLSNYISHFAYKSFCIQVCFSFRLRWLKQMRRILLIGLAKSQYKIKLRKFKNTQHSAGGGGWTEESGDDNFYWWFLEQGQRNAQFELGFVCLDGDYHSQNQVGFEYCRWG